MKSAKQWVSENSQSGAFDCIQFESGEALVEAIQKDALASAGVITLPLKEEFIPEHVPGVLRFRKEIETAINRQSKENGSNTPDFILAEYLENCLIMFDKAVRDREKWYGRLPQVECSPETQSGAESGKAVVKPE